MSESLNSPNIFELKLEVQKFGHGFLLENTVFKRGEVNCFQDFGDVLPFPAIYWFPASPHNAESKMWNRKSYLICLSQTLFVNIIFLPCIDCLPRFSRQNILQDVLTVDNVYPLKKIALQLFIKMNTNYPKYLVCFREEQLKSCDTWPFTFQKTHFPSFDIRDSSIGLFTTWHFSLLYFLLSQ